MRRIQFNRSCRITVTITCSNVSTFDMAGISWSSCSSVWGLVLTGRASITSIAQYWTVKMQLCQASKISRLWKDTLLRPNPFSETTDLRWDCWKFSFSWTFAWNSRSCKSTEVYRMLIRNLMTGSYYKLQTQESWYELILSIKSVQILLLTPTPPGI